MYCNSIFKKHYLIVLALLALFAGATFLLYSTAISPDQSHRLIVWTSTDNDVEVRIEIIKAASGQLSLSATFTPTRRQFYLYSKDLPKDGLNGLGRPTLLEVVRSDSIKLTGPLEANQPVQNAYVKPLDLSFPVYPVGPVTLSVPFELIANSNLVSMEVAVTYMACSDKTCLPPVINKHAFVEVPPSFFDDEGR